MPLQPLYLESDSLRIGANQFLTQANAVYVGNNLHVGNTLIFGAIGGGANNQWTVPAFSNNKIVITANNVTPNWGSGAIDLRVGTGGGRVGITFSSNTNAFSDHAYIYYYDNVGGYATGAVGTENGLLLLGVQNDSTGNPAAEDVVAIEGPGNIYINPGMGTDQRVGATSWSNTSGNLWIGNNSVRYLSIHEGLQAPFTLRAPITFSNSANALIFSGASNTNIALRTSPNGILSFDGGAGALLTISNNVLGQIFSVNDISGFPIIEVTANTVPSNTAIQMGQFGSRVFIGTNTTTNSTLTVTGGGTVPAVTAANVGVYFSILPSAGAGAYNPLVSAGDVVMYFSNGTVGQGNLVVGPHTGYTGGFGIKLVGNTFHTQISGNTFAVSNGTVNTAFFAANGNIGFGNSLPTARFTVQAPSTITSVASFIGDSSNTGLTNHQNALDLRNVNNTDNNYFNVVFRDNDGTAAADITGRFSSHLNGYGDLFFHTRGADGYVRRFSVEPAATYVANSTATSFFVAANGNVGVANTTPTDKLRVEGTASVSSNLTVSGVTSLLGRTIRYSSEVGISGFASNTWVNLGRFQNTGTGDTVKITFVAGRGFNGSAGQHSESVIIIRAGNGVGQNISGTHYNIGQSAVINAVKMRSVNTISTDTHWDIFAEFVNFPGLGIYRVETASSVTWTHSLSSTTDPGAANSTLIVATNEFALAPGTPILSGSGALPISNTVGQTLGDATRRWNLTANSGSFSGDVTVSGNLTVSGTRTYINTTTLDVGDNIVVLNADVSGATAPTENAGIEINRGSSANASLIFNEASDSWVFNTGGVEQFRVNHAASAVNFVQVAGNTAGAPPVVSVQGTDTNIGFALNTKGTGAFQVSTGGGEQLRVIDTASAVNYIQATGAATTATPTITAQGSDTNITLRLGGKGSGTVDLASSGNPYALQVQGVASAADYNNWRMTSGAGGSGLSSTPVLSTWGIDTNISMALRSKGTGAINLAPGSSGVNISNGATVTAITVTNSGAGYTSIPGVVIAAPTTAGGVQATANALMFTGTATVAGGGTGYTPGDTLTVTGGTFSGLQGTYTVATVSGGVITSVTRVTGSGYSVLPSNPVSVTGGTGTGATLNLTWTVNSFNITNAGSGYVEQPAVTFSGGGGSGAAAYATVGSGTTVRTLGSTMDVVTPNGGRSFRFYETAGGTGVNYWSAQAGASAPYLYAQGSGNVEGRIASNGSSPITIWTNGGTNQQFAVAHTASAVNWLQVTGAATGNQPLLSVQGTDTNISLSLTSKGTGGINFWTNNSTNRQLAITDTASAVNYVQVTGAATGGSVVISAQGSDANIPLNLQAKGSGYINTIGWMRVGTASANYIQLQAAGAGSSPVYAVAGSDTNIDLNLTAKGTGVTHSTTPLQVETDTVITTRTLTTTATTTDQTIASFAGATYRSAQFIIQATDATGTKYQKTVVLAIHNGTIAEFTEYGGMDIGGSCGTYNVLYSGGNLILAVTPTSTNSTVFKVTCILTRV